MREVIINHVTNSLDVQTTSRHIRCHDHVDLAGHQLTNRSLALLLSNVTVQSRSDDAFLNQVFRDNHGALTGFNKHQHAVDFFGLEQSHQAC